VDDKYQQKIAAEGGDHQAHQLRVDSKRAAGMVTSAAG
jgi:hypothetical protein